MNAIWTPSGLASLLPWRRRLPWRRNGRRSVKFSGFPAQDLRPSFGGRTPAGVWPFSDPDLGTALTETCNGLPKNWAIFHTLLLLPRDAESAANEPAGICPKFFLSGPVHRNGAVKVLGR